MATPAGISTGKDELALQHNGYSERSEHSFHLVSLLAHSGPSRNLIRGCRFAWGRRVVRYPAGYARVITVHHPSHNPNRDEYIAVVFGETRFDPSYVLLRRICYWVSPLRVCATRMSSGSDSVTLLLTVDHERSRMRTWYMPGSGNLNKSSSFTGKNSRSWRGSIVETRTWERQLEEVSAGARNSLSPEGVLGTEFEMLSKDSRTSDFIHGDKKNTSILLVLAFLRVTVRGQSVRSTVSLDGELPCSIPSTKPGAAHGVGDDGPSPARTLLNRLSNKQHIRQGTWSVSERVCIVNILVSNSR